MTQHSDLIKIVFLADTHLGFDYPIRPRVNSRRRGDDFFANYKKILDHAKSSADIVIHGGDMFYKSRVHEKIVDMAYKPLLEVAESGVPVFIYRPKSLGRIGSMCMVESNKSTLCL